MAKTQEFKPEEIQIVEMYSKGPVDKEHVADLAADFQRRRAEGMPHQSVVGKVRAKDNGFVCLAGRHRILAMINLNKALAKDEEPYLFEAIVIRTDTDAQAVEDSLVDNIRRRDISIFERGEYILELMNLGRSQRDIATVLGLDESTVSQTLAAAKLPAKLKKMVMDGDLEQDAALNLAKEPDTAIRSEMIEEAVRHRTFLDEMYKRIEARANGEEKGEDKKGGKKGGKEDEEEERSSRTSKKGKKPSKITKEDTSRAAKRVKPSSPAAQPSSTLTRKQLLAHLEAIRSDKDNPIPKSARAVMNAFEALFDGEMEPKTFRNRLIKFCVPDEVKE